jgi:fatty acid desaturase
LLALCNSLESGIFVAFFLRKRLLEMQSKLSIQQVYKRRSNIKGALAVGRDGLFLLGAWFIAVQWGQYWWLSLAVVWFIGAVQFAMGESLLHEASHGNLFKTAWLNKCVGKLIAYSIFTTLRAWKAEHSTHHGQLLSEQDHLTHDYRSYQLDTGIHPFRLWVLRPFLGWVGVQWVRSELLGLWKHREVMLFYGLVLAGAFYVQLLSFFLLYWLLPLVWVYPAVLYWSEITDHHLAEQATRSNTSFFWNFMFHNGGYHWAHHEYPFIPWYLLPKADRALTSQKRDTMSGWWGMYQVLLKEHARLASQRPPQL